MNTHFRETDTYVQFSVDTRNNIEKAVEGLLSLLDQMDPDPDLEANGDDELSMGAAENGSKWVPCLTGDDDREEELEHDEESDPGEDNGDLEPYLSTGTENWAAQAETHGLDYEQDGLFGY